MPFLDRPRELGRFRRMLAGQTDERILLILEQAEKGKTCFLMKLFDECEQQHPPLPVVLLDFDRGLAHLALGHPDQALADYQAALPLADPIPIAEALKELDEFAAAYPDTIGLDAVRALFPSPS